MIKKILWSNIFIIIAVLLQSTLFSRLLLFFHISAIPDLALCILVFSSYTNGMMTGQLTGFFSGFFIDFLSSAPLGLNVFTRTLTGALAGLLRGNLMLDTVILPAGLCAGATVFKALLLIALNFLFAGAVPAYSWTTPTLWIEILLNALLAPFLFDFLKKFDTLLVKIGGYDENR
ncbi:MAG: rod shape-determining protein MreD [Spirochaetaceae bacterium]|nr:rod shape-determining protein MreD [Spirochaetaceae bacterium]